jgi:hypothetical protein
MRKDNKKTTGATSKEVAPILKKKDLLISLFHLNILNKCCYYSSALVQ